MKSQKIKFELINNVILIPIEVNGVALKFLLDTGVSKPIIFNFIKGSDSLKILNSEKIKIKGLGDGDYIDALRSSHNTFKIGEAINTDQTLFAVFDSRINLAPKLGTPIDGIIGYDIFKDFIVEINYASRYIKLYNPTRYKYKKCNRCEVLDLEFKDNRPYLNANVTIQDKLIPVKLLMDSGGSDALWLFEDKTKGLVLNDKYFEDFLGSGLSGDVYGKRTKIEALNINQFIINKPKVAFPDSVMVNAVKKFKDRDGTIGGEILKRFNLIVDYSNAKITFKKNSSFNNAFSYNKSGLQVEHDGVRVVMEINVEENNAHFRSEKSNTLSVNSIVKTNRDFSLKPTFVIHNVVKNSPAYWAGVQKGDVILSINSKNAFDLKLNQIVNHFYKKSGTKIKLLLVRHGYEKAFEFRLKSPVE
ncbi:retropepsin-like aspartic protease [Olleya marilimosa]|uniref:retropepsin-like aspartic protease n=1 Tax=Olleya marilimosa TaxID=272164 RepID=UPI001E383D55|nr:retropepsin-like aspartic protease [Olleya marilimosa]